MLIERENREKKKKEYSVAKSTKKTVTEFVSRERNECVNWVEFTCRHVSM
jgi:hypothetical protein